MKLFIMSMRIQSPAVLECISLPCLRILQHIINPSPPASKKNKVLHLMCIIIIIIITVYGNMFDLKVKPKLATHITQSFHPRRSLLASVTRNSRGSSIGFPPRETFLLRKIDCTSCSAPRMIEVTPLGDTVKSGSTEAGR